MPRTNARVAMLAAVSLLEERGLNHLSSGNISVRVEGGLLITPTGGHSGNMTALSLVAIDMEGRNVGPGTPSSEWPLHTSVHSAYPFIGAVVHTHADSCVALSCLRRPIPAFHYMVASFGGDDIRCADYARFGSARLAANVVAALEGRTACLMANHGMLAVGGSLDEAVNRAIKLETLARQYLMCLAGGTPVLLSAGEMSDARAVYGDYGRRRLRTV